MSKILCRISLSSDARALPPLFLGHNEFIKEVGSQLTFFLSTHITAFRLGHFTVPVCALFIHPPLLVPRPPLFDEFHLHSVLSAHSHSHTLDQCFSDFSWVSYSNTDSDSVGLRHGAIRFLISTTIPVMPMRLPTTL